MYVYMPIPVLQLLPKSASVRGFFLFHYIQNWPEYVMKQVQYFKEGKLKSIVDIGEKQAAGPFVGLESIPDAVEVRNIAFVLYGLFILTFNSCKPCSEVFNPIL